MVGRDDAVKVTDFGIARAAGSSTLTATGMVMGTANYISPEQAQGVDLTPQSDIYSLGVVLYEMVTGSVPFTADSPLAVALRHVNDDLPSASELNTDVPAELDQLIARATAKDPTHRFADARALQQELRTFAADQDGQVTAALGAGDGGSVSATGKTVALATEEAEQTTALAPLTASWNTRRLGAAVLLVFGALFAVAVALLIYRVIADEPRERAGSGRRAARTPAAPIAPRPAYTVDLDDLLGRSLVEVVPMLEERGLDVDVQLVGKDQIKEELGVEEPIPGIVYFVDPTNGTALEEGDTITLFAMSEETDEGDEEGPGNSEGKGHGKDKDKDD
ncbi:MAG TPA: protein kinase, partial [Actinomycetota bacterium]|nr:protein kinase [Actinomycetota bacterium]